MTHQNPIYAIKTISQTKVKQGVPLPRLNPVIMLGMFTTFFCLTEYIISIIYCRHFTVLCLNKKNNKTRSIDLIEV
jgi:hypothetical protein